MAAWYAFDCPDCPSEFDVDSALRTELLDDGCLWCGATLTPAAFTPTDPPESSC